VGRERSKRAIEAAAASDMLILFVAQKTDEEAPTSEGVFGVGTVARLLQRRDLPDGTAKVLVECVERAAILNYTDRSEYHEADIVVIESQASPTQAFPHSLIAKFEEYVKVEKNVSPNVVDAVRRAGDVGRMADTVASHIAGEIADRQAVLETTSVSERIEKIVSLMDKRIASRRPRRGVGDELNKPTPAIWFRRRAGEASLSKLGGLPSMPSDFEWPKQHQSGTPLHFLAQIDLSHLPATPLGNGRGAPRLPKSGLLFFFADMVEEMLWDQNGGALANTRVIFASHAGPERSLPEDMPSIGHAFGAMTSAYSSGNTFFDQAALEPNVIGTFSAGVPLIPDAVAAAAVEDPDRWNRRKAEGPPDWPLHQMLGNGKDIQGAAGRAHSDGLILLLQIDTDMAVDKEFIFCDMGVAQFWIKPADLAAKRFNNAWATTEGG
jgi:Lon protease-like protein